MAPLPRHDGAGDGMTTLVAAPSDIQQPPDAARALDNEIVERLVCRSLQQGLPW